MLRPTLRHLLLEQTAPVGIAVHDDEGWFGNPFPKGVDELYFSTPGNIADIAHLKTLFEIFAETLDQLTRIGSASDCEPGVQL